MGFLFKPITFGFSGDYDWRAGIGMLCQGLAAGGVAAMVYADTLSVHMKQGAVVCIALGAVATFLMAQGKPVVKEPPA